VWRDVDVRLMLADEVYAAMGFGAPADSHSNPRWMAMCAAFSALGKQMTGLPIDFQIQQLTDANERFGKGKGTVRSCLGIIGLQMYTLPPPAEEGRSYVQLIAETQAHCDPEEE
jgi:hypothetical protein